MSKGLILMRVYQNAIYLDASIAEGGDVLDYSYFISFKAEDPTDELILII